VKVDNVNGHCEKKIPLVWLELATLSEWDDNDITLLILVMLQQVIRFLMNLYLNSGEVSHE